MDDRALRGGLFQLPFRDSHPIHSGGPRRQPDFQLPFRDSASISALAPCRAPFNSLFGIPGLGLPPTAVVHPDLSTPFSGFPRRRGRARGRRHLSTPFSGFLSEGREGQGGGWAFNSLFGILTPARPGITFTVYFQLPFRDSFIFTLM